MPWYIGMTILGRGVALGYTLVLLASLSTDGYASFGYMQITAAVLSQVVLGPLANLIGARYARISNARAQAELTIAFGYYAALGALLLVGLWAAVSLRILQLSGIECVLIVGLVQALGAAQLVTQFLISRNDYIKAAVQSGIQAVVLVFAIASAPRSSEVATGWLFIGSAAPMCLIVAWHLLKPNPRSDLRGSFRRASWIALAHLDAIKLNATYIPHQLLLWVLASHLKSATNPVEFSLYVISNQVATLYLSIPIMFSALGVRLLAEHRVGVERRRVVLLLTLAFVFAGAVAVGVADQALPILVDHLSFMPSGSGDAIVSGLGMAVLLSLRIPVAWSNQIERRSGAEAIAGLLGGGALMVGFIGGWTVDAASTIGIRTAAAAIVLVESWLLLMMRRDRGATGNDKVR